ncbi:CNP1-like family protein [Candidatus Accumulibacter sp. ACC007]|uniref:CNP1-like family protein n=1 Tax=Candidatus Accumulibacter sp. ACC007 TaxID=2823333 RepID=UPI0025B81883|nr:CNP1-like family protein [Candidatus Accumulibacter sp. ACC007]
MKSTVPELQQRTRPSRAVSLSCLACCFLPLAALLSPPASSASDDSDGGGSAKQGTEAIEVQFPAFPQAENLIPFTVSATAESKFMIDSESLSVSPERVVYYTLVIVSSAGARNVSYEAIRCATGERRVYGFGRSDDTWSKARSEQWLRIQESTVNRQHAALFGEYFCTVGTSLRDADDARRILRSGGHRANLRP